MAADGPNRGVRLTPAQAALRMAAQELAVHKASPPPAAMGEEAPPAAAPPPMAAPSAGPVRPVEHPSYGVCDPDGTSLGTYVSEGGLLHHDVTVREAATAPAATIRVHRHRHVLAEPDGRELACCWRAFSAVGNDDDDEVWGL